MRAETGVAINAARLARQIADSRVGADAVQFKEGIDIVTAADVACEDAIREELARSFPEHPVVGEERGGEPRGDQPYWLVDPICGTRCYASDVPLYCTNIALVERDEVTAAAIAIGRSNELLYAEKGGGAWLIADGDGTRIEQPKRLTGDGLAAAGEFAPAREHTSRRIATSAASNVVWIHGHGKPFADFARAIWSDGRWFVWSFSSTVGYAFLAAGRIAGHRAHRRARSTQRTARAHGRWFSRRARGRSNAHRRRHGGALDAGFTLVRDRRHPAAAPRARDAREGVAMSDPTRGTCLCGAVSFVVEPPFHWLAHCHCSMCRKHHGTLFGTGLGVERSKFRWLSGADDIVHYRSTDSFERAFCRAAARRYRAIHICRMSSSFRPARSTATSA
jgi:fructose-1,6-bisphosphatase/inositol monophosphatase family enzyme